MGNLFLLLLTAALLPPCLIPIFIMRPRAQYGHLFFIFYGIGLQFLLSLPAGLFQAFYYVGHVQAKSLHLRMALPVLAAPFNVGGATLRCIYEAVVGPPSPALSGVASGAISAFHVYLPLLVLQAALLAHVFARRFASRRSFRDPIVLALGATVLTNSMLNVTWPWWGS
ncbi:MAG: hypothetical protein ACR2IE_07610 [Candidatus Sumerlaeaceae bacterium]